MTNWKWTKMYETSIWNERVLSHQLNVIFQNNFWCPKMQMTVSFFLLIPLALIWNSVSNLDFRIWGFYIRVNSVMNLRISNPNLWWIIWLGGGGAINPHSVTVNSVGHFFYTPTNNWLIFIYASEIENEWRNYDNSFNYGYCYYTLWLWTI